MKLKTYSFTLILNGINEQTLGLEDALYEAHCDDALINFRDGVVYLDFDRKDSALENAVISAIGDVESANINATVISVAPEPYVSISDMAKRFHTNKQTVSLWVKGKRRPDNPFPSPVMKVADKSPLWRWFDVVKWWLITNKELADDSMLKDARFFEAINAALQKRDTQANKERNRLANLLSSKCA